MPTWFSNKKNSTQSPSNDLPNEIEPLVQFLNNEKDRELYTVIYTKVTKEKHTHDRPQNGDRTLKKCIELFKQGADPNILTKLEALLREQKEHHKYYIKHFLPALLGEIIQSKELELQKIEQVLKITSDVIKRSDDEEYKQYYLKTLLSKLELTAGKLETKKMIMELKISDDLNKIINESHPSAEIQEQSTNADKEIDNKILSSLNIPKEIREKYSKVMEEMMEKIKRCTKTSELGNSLGSREENKNQMQPEQAIEDTPPKKQSNNRNFHIVLVTGCILSAVGCLVAGIITAGAILFAMASAFAAAAVVTWYLTSPSSEFTSTNLSSPSVGGKEYKH